VAILMANLMNMSSRRIVRHLGYLRDELAFAVLRVALTTQNAGEGLSEQD
jgi:hypothetical protein